MRFRGLQNYTTLKPELIRRQNAFCFRGLQNYTTLKHGRLLILNQRGFRGLQNYTTLKPQIKFETQE